MIRINREKAMKILLYHFTHRRPHFERGSVTITTLFALAGSLHFYHNFM